MSESLTKLSSKDLAKYQNASYAVENAEKLFDAYRDLYHPMRQQQDAEAEARLQRLAQDLLDKHLVVVHGENEELSIDEYKVPNFKHFQTKDKVKSREKAYGFLKELAI